MPSSPPAPLVIFDLDGTLVETGPDLVASLNHAIATIDLAPFAIEAVGHLVGRGARAMIERALSERRVEPEIALIDRLQSVFLEHYRNDLPGLSRPYPGTLGSLDRLQEAGLPLAVCTNKQEALARQLLDALGLSSRFSAIAGGDTFAVRKPEAGHILETIRLAGSVGPAVMVGDSVNDVAAARAAGIPSVVVSFGYSDIPVAELGASEVIDHYDALTPELVRGLVGPATLF